MTLYFAFFNRMFSRYVWYLFRHFQLMNLILVFTEYNYITLLSNLSFFLNPKKWRRLFRATPASASSQTQSSKSDNENFKGPIAGWSCERCWYSCQAGLRKSTYAVEEKLREQRRKYAKPQYLKSIERPSLSRGNYTINS